MSDPDALQATKMGRTAATYVMTHGTVEEFKNVRSDKSRSSFFSLNVDKATNNAGNKVLNVLVQYFDEDQQSTLVELLGSREVNQVTSENIFNALTEILQDRGLKWEQVISCLMDNCSVMRGVKMEWRRK